MSPRYGADIHGRRKLGRVQIECEEDRTLRAALVDMLREDERNA
jgi:hypothetical protein